MADVAAGAVQGSVAESWPKKSSGVASVSKPEAIDTALCHGWIDGQLDSFDEAYWLIRFTPRHSTSRWSEKNRARALQLIDQERHAPWRI